MEVKVQFISQELIKPSTPTPLHLRHYQFSLLDQIEFPEWMPFVLFYSKEPFTKNIERCSKSKESLSKALTIFYPLAGRLHDTFINCNDEGILFVEAQANCTLFDILRNANPSDHNKFLPLPLDDCKDFVAFIQFTFLKCGGLAISLTMSHKLGDALSKLTFLNCWAAITRRDTDSNFLDIPPFTSAVLFPPQNISGYDPGPDSPIDKLVTKVFVFDASIIAALKAKYSKKNGGRIISGVNTLSAFIWSRFMAATQENRTGKKTYLVQNVVNLRPRMEPPLSNLYFGNLTATTDTVADMNAEDDDCYGIVNQMIDAIKNVNADFVKDLQRKDVDFNFYKERSEKLSSGELIEFMFTSLCKFPLYESDFGGGKPFWVASACLPSENLAIFHDTKEGNGIESWITLYREDMAKFEVDKELLAHVSSKSIANQFLFQPLDFSNFSRL